MKKVVLCPKPKAAKVDCFFFFFCMKAFLKRCCANLMKLFDSSVGFCAGTATVKTVDKVEFRRTPIDAHLKHTGHL